MTWSAIALHVATAYESSTLASICLHGAQPFHHLCPPRVETRIYSFHPVQYLYQQKKKEEVLKWCYIQVRAIEWNGVQNGNQTQKTAHGSPLSPHKSHTHPLVSAVSAIQAMPQTGIATDLVSSAYTPLPWFLEQNSSAWAGLSLPGTAAH